MNTIDYPAAHSMDTEWFAVDGQGHVAIFVTHEPGHMPADLREQSYADEVVDPLMALLFPGPIDQDEDDYRDRLELAPDCGLFVYEYSDEYSLIGLLYQRNRVPSRPIHIDQLPPAVRSLCSRQQFDKVDFTQDEFIQPVEHVECKGWHLEAYLDRDGVTVRPLPGHEGSFAEWVRKFVRENPEEAGRYVFVPPSNDEDSPAT